MRLIGLFAGIIAGGLNFALLALGSAWFLHGKKKAGLLLLLLGPGLPLVGFALCVAFSRPLLPWFGMAAGAALVLPAIIYFAMGKHIAPSGDAP